MFTLHMPNGVVVGYAVDEWVYEIFDKRKGFVARYIFVTAIRVLKLYALLDAIRYVYPFRPPSPRIIYLVTQMHTAPQSTKRSHARFSHPRVAPIISFGRVALKVGSGWTTLQV
ncbi:hypothetical protein FRC12_011988 [Ceratobasidium sp. 428]|nr:hypothetical protein FRC12_011988 [Ceratobasidium sp. 428]